MELEPLLRGMLIGLAIAAPVGPIGVLCIRRTLSDGLVAGVVSGLGAASADLVYGIIAALGLAALSAWLLEVQPWLKLFGGLFLCYLGLRIMLSRPSDSAAQARGNSLLSAYLGTFGLTLTNPLTIVSFAAIIAGSNASVSSAGAAFQLILGIFLGSAAWWVLLSAIVNSLRTFAVGKRLRLINIAAGLLILGFGCLALFG